MAELILLADPTAFRVFREDALSIDFDRVAELKSWLHLAGLNDPDMLTGGHDGVSDDGRPYRSMSAYPKWHGWEIYANATEYSDTTGELNPQLADQLAELAAEETDVPAGVTG
ncbi:hypothetical protein [Actinoplanes sp. NPDC089786]|uniref:hypothetical protein n=1 Tax=Actinoplanes sp. NPDC089786 TaxID=3155185 RepID=UPI00342DB64C